MQSKIAKVQIAIVKIGGIIIIKSMIIKIGIAVCDALRTHHIIIKSGITVCDTSQGSHN